MSDSINPKEFYALESRVTVVETHLVEMKDDQKQLIKDQKSTLEAINHVSKQMSEKINDLKTVISSRECLEAERLSKMENGIEENKSFRWKLIGIALGVSTIIGVLIAIFFGG